MSSFTNAEEVDASYCDNLETFLKRENEIDKGTRAYKVKDSLINTAKKIDSEIDNHDIKQNYYYGEWSFNLDGDVYFNKYNIVSSDDGLDVAMSKDGQFTQLCINRSSYK